MGRRLELHEKLKELFGSDHVYYQPPENVKMEYPAIRYSLNGIFTFRANDSLYGKRPQYQIIVIDRLPNNAVIEKILELPYSEYTRHYETDGLNHDVLTLYY